MNTKTPATNTALATGGAKYKKSYIFMEEVW